jgi:hypothetical protein
MSMRCLFVSYDPQSMVSNVINWYARGLKMASHAGWIDPETMFTYSAQSDGKGLDWRPPDSRAIVTMLSAPGTEASLSLALNDRGAKYDFLNIAGIALSRDWSKPGEFICDKAVFWFQKMAGCPLLNHDLYPMELLTPPDILKSPYVLKRSV